LPSPSKSPPWIDVRHHCWTSVCGERTLLLRAVAVVPESQLWTLQEPDRSRIARGLAWAAETTPHESDPASLAKQKRTPRSRPRGQRR
jgi:hypothetical protein